MGARDITLCAVIRLGLRRIVHSALVFLLLASTSATIPTMTRPLQAVAASTGSWTTYHHDDGRTGLDSSLPAIASAVAGWTSAAMDGEVYAEPLVYNGLVYAATLNNTVYAFNQSTGALVWSNHLRAPETSGWSCGNVSPQGILGTPVIDATAGRIYVVTLGSDDIYRVEGLSLSNGTGVLTTAIPTNLGPGFDWTIQQQRGAIGLRNGFIYVPFGGRAGDCGTYHGWVYGVPTSGAAVTNFYVTPGAGAGFWTAGGVTIDDSTGNVFATSGNGVGSGCAANPNGTPVYENDAVVRLSSTLAHMDSFIPQDWQANWCGNDQDLGSAGSMLISSSLMFQAGKWGAGFLLDPNNLGGMDGQLFPTKKPAAYQEAPVCFGNHSDATFGSFAYAAPFVYLECDGHGIVALSTNTGAPSFAACGSTCPSPDWHGGGSITFGPPIVAGSAVWAVDIGGSGLYAFNATTGAQQFHSAAFGVNHFVTPAEAGGQVFVPSHMVIRSFNMVFPTAPTSLGGTWTSSPSVASWAPGRLDVFIRGTDNALWHSFWTGTAWSPFESLGGVLTSDPAAVSWGPGRLDVFVRGTDNQLWHKVYAGAWSGWEPLGGGLSSGPEVASWSSGRLDVFVQGTDNQLWHKFWSGSWSGWEPLGGVLVSDPGAVSWGRGRIDIFVRGTDNQAWHKFYAGGWSGWEARGGNLTSAPTASSCAPGHLDVFATGAGSALFQTGFDGSSWSVWQNHGGQWTSDPSAVCQSGSPLVDVFQRGTDNALWTETFTGS